MQGAWEKIGGSLFLAPSTSEEYECENSRKRDLLNLTHRTKQLVKLTNI